MTTQQTIQYAVRCICSRPSPNAGSRVRWNDRGATPTGYPIRKRRGVIGPDGRKYPDANAAGDAAGVKTQTIVAWINKAPDRGWKWDRPIEQRKIEDHDGELLPGD